MYTISHCITELLEIEKQWAFTYLFMCLLGYDADVTVIKNALAVIEIHICFTYQVVCIVYHEIHPHTHLDKYHTRLSTCVHCHSDIDLNICYQRFLEDKLTKHAINTSKRSTYMLTKEMCYVQSNTLNKTTNVKTTQ